MCFRDHAELVTAASTVLVTVSASFLVTLSAPRARTTVRSASPFPRRPWSARPPLQLHAVVAVSPTTREHPRMVPPGNEGKPGDRRGPNRGTSRDHGHHVGADADDQGHNGDDQGQEGNDQGQDENADDQGENNDNQGDNENANDDQGASGSDDDQGDGGNSQD